MENLQAVPEVEWKNSGNSYMNQNKAKKIETLFDNTQRQYMRPKCPKQMKNTFAYFLIMRTWFNLLLRCTHTLNMFVYIRSIQLFGYLFVFFFVCMPTS